MPPQEKIPPQESGREKRMSQQPDIRLSQPETVDGYSKTDEDMSRVAGEITEQHLTTSPGRKSEIAATNATNTQTEVRSGEVSTRAAVKMKMSRQFSLNDTALQEKNTQACEKLPSPQATGPVQEEKPIMDFDEMLPHIGGFGLYQKILFIMLGPFAFFVAFVYFTQIFITVTPEEYWCRIPELTNLTPEQR
jgi:hypothetical protein